MYYSTERLRDYASLFSSQTCNRSLRFNDVEDIARVYQKYDSEKYKDIEFSVWDYLSRIYRILKTNYRNEYVYKNELVSVLLKLFGKSETVLINEFRMGKSVADLAMFNGSSKAFEIKTELDSNRRLVSQIQTYTSLFEECFIVVPEALKDRYESIVSESVGIILFSHSDRGRIEIRKYRNAIINPDVDINVLMSAVRTEEYKWMVKTSFGFTPCVSCFSMFDSCRDLLSSLPSSELHSLFNTVIKRRDSVFPILSELPKSTRQMVLSLNPAPSKLELLNDLYNTNLNNNQLCIHPI